MDKKTTLLDCVVKSMYDKNETKLMDVVEELSILEGAAKLSGTELKKSMENLVKEFQELEQEHRRVPQDQISSLYATRLSMYTTRFQLVVTELNRYKTIMLRKLIETMEYFGEDSSKDMDAGRVFSTLLLFRKSLSESRDVLERRERMASRSRSVSR